MKKTKIEWCDSTWNPVTGCFHKCKYCYARSIADRFGLKFVPKLGDPGMEGAKKYDSEEEGQDTMLELRKPYKKDGKMQPYPFGFNPTLHKYRLNEPWRWTKPRSIFVCSMADLFGDWVPDEWIRIVMGACLVAPQHTYLFLTKNPRRYVQLSEEYIIPDLYHNVWFGATVTNKKQLEEATEAFRSLPALILKFFSIEPILEDISEEILNTHVINDIDGIVIGAETGNRKDKIIPQKEWIDNICHATGPYTPVFMKDSLIPIIGEENMRRELPWQST